jgi:hypothetical protein
MLVRLCWPDCDFWNGKWGTSPVDAVWVECSMEEAKDLVHPRLDAAAVALSEQLGAGVEGPPSCAGRPKPGFCFLVAADLTRTEPHPVSYPWSGMWNAYCPFRGLPEREVGSLGSAVALGGRPRRPWRRFWR